MLCVLGKHYMHCIAFSHICAVKYDKDVDKLFFKTRLRIRKNSNLFTDLFCFLTYMLYLWRKFLTYYSKSPKYMFRCFLNEFDFYVLKYTWYFYCNYLVNGNQWLLLRYISNQHIGSVLLSYFKLIKLNVVIYLSYC